MDPKLSNLDPKLQDAYHRVMGNTAPGATQELGQNPAPPPAAEPQTPTTNADPSKSAQAPQSVSIPGVNSTMAFNAEDSHKNVGTTAVKSGGFHAMPIVIGLGIIILLVAYTFVWIMLFNVRVPFLPQL